VNSTTYFYVVSAANGVGESLNSLEAPVTPQPALLCAIQAQVNGQYVTANGTNVLIASQSTIGPNERFAKYDFGNGNSAFQSVASGLFVTLSASGSLNLRASSLTAGSWETFATTPLVGGNIAFSSIEANGSYISADNYGVNPLIANRTTIGAWETFNLVLLIADAPNGVTALGRDSRVLMNWNEPVGATGYNIYRATVSHGSYSLIATNVSGTGYTDYGVTNGITYYYIVSAVNAAGESANSSEVSATPVSVGTLSIKAGVFPVNGLTLSWNNGAASLHQTFSLAPPVNWTLLTNEPLYSNGLWNLNLPFGTNGCSFYRLEYY
jgi:cellulose 1,4-beta-cellobiosidase